MSSTVACCKILHLARWFSQLDIFPDSHHSDSTLYIYIDIDLHSHWYPLISIDIHIIILVNCILLNHGIAMKSPRNHQLPSVSEAGYYCPDEPGQPRSYLSTEPVSWRHGWTWPKIGSLQMWSIYWAYNIHIYICFYSFNILNTFIYIIYIYIYHVLFLNK